MVDVQHYNSVQLTEKGIQFLKQRDTLQLARYYYGSSSGQKSSKTKQQHIPIANEKVGNNLVFTIAQNNGITQL